MWANKISLDFQAFMAHNFRYHYAMAMNFSAHIIHLIGVIMQIIECTYSIPILRYDQLCDRV